MPLSHLRPGMHVLVPRDGGFVRAEVEAVEHESYSGPVYDLEVDPTHTYVADGVLVHNSIYRFRGADIANILEFEEAFPDATVILLEQNYRSTQTILDAANAVIANNMGRKPKELWTDQGGGEAIARFHAEDEVDEAQWVAARCRSCTRAVTALGRHGGLLPDQRAEPGARGLAHAGRHPVPGHRRHPLLRPPGGQGRAGLPPGGREPGRRGVGQAGAQRPEAGRRGQHRRAARLLRRRATASRSPRRCAGPTTPG